MFQDVWHCAKNRWLNMVAGIADSEDLPLNIDRNLERPPNGCPNLGRLHISDECNGTSWCWATHGNLTIMGIAHDTTLNPELNRGVVYVVDWSAPGCDADLHLELPVGSLYRCDHSVITSWLMWDCGAVQAIGASTWIYLFAQLGVMLFSSTVIIVIYTFFLQTPLLMLAGPTGDCCGAVSLLLCRRPRRLVAWMFRVHSKAKREKTDAGEQKTEVDMGPWNCPPSAGLAVVGPGYLPPVLPARCPGHRALRPRRATRCLGYRGHRDLLRIVPLMSGIPRVVVLKTYRAPVVVATTRDHGVDPCVTRPCQGPFTRGLPSPVGPWHPLRPT